MVYDIKSNIYHSQIGVEPFTEIIPAQAKPLAERCVSFIELILQYHFFYM